jgi:lysozyme family protein
MNTWDDYWKFLVEWEGRVFENDPDDDGNKGDGKTSGNFGTKYGVDAASHPGVNIRELTEEQASSIYEREFRNGPFADLPFIVGVVCFDFGMNAGTSTAVKCLQRVSGVTADGLIGPNTRAAFAICYVDEEKRGQVLLALLDCRRAYYRSLAENSSRLRKYLKGWLNRVDALQGLVL